MIGHEHDDGEARRREFLTFHIDDFYLKVKQKFEFYACFVLENINYNVTDIWEAALQGRMLSPSVMYYWLQHISALHCLQMLIQDFSAPLYQPGPHWVCYQLWMI